MNDVDNYAVFSSLLITVNCHRNSYLLHILVLHHQAYQLNSWVAIPVFLVLHVYK